MEIDLSSKICGYVEEYPVYQFIYEPIKSNMFMLLKDKEALVIDPNDETETKGILNQLNLDLVDVILTHEHYDHVSGVKWIRDNFNCRVIAHNNTKRIISVENELTKYYLLLLMDKREWQEQAKRKVPKSYICDVDVTFEDVMYWDWQDITLLLKSCPGHSPGSICISYQDDYLFAGDCLVEGRKIITKLPGGNKNDYLNITKPYLESFSKECVVFPGHGSVMNIEKFEM